MSAHDQRDDDVQAAAGERWCALIVAAQAHVKDENGLTVAVVSGDAREATVRESAFMIAAAPALRDALTRLFDWVEANVAYGVPRALAEDCGQALEDSRAPQ